MIFPTDAFSWGPLTHTFLGNELLSIAYLLPPAVYSVIRKFKDDFIYGNIVADIVIGKKYLPEEKSSHTWDFGFNLLKMSASEQQRAFVYGFLCHLAADTVAHDILTKEKRNFQHTMCELKADSFINKRFWVKAISIKRKVQKRNDAFLEHSINRLFFSFKTNKRIFKSLVYMSIFTSVSLSNIAGSSSRFFLYSPDKQLIKKLTDESLLRMLDILTKGEDSPVVKDKPTGVIVHGKLYKSLFMK
ncbi:MAG: zinc dependent phospholipase C family protein [Nitrospirae bacterium]|nr:zinc dependent phospholipase C family protein [Nitrospirota bacterium]